MAVTDRTVVQFSNEVIRPACDCLGSLLMAIERGAEQYQNKVTGDGVRTIGQVLTEAADDTMGDGAASDGRGVITAQDVRTVIAECAALRAWAQGRPGLLDLLYKVGVNIR